MKTKGDIIFELLLSLNKGHCDNNAHQRVFDAMNQYELLKAEGCLPQGVIDSQREDRLQFWVPKRRLSDRMTGPCAET